MPRKRRVIKKSLSQKGFEKIEKTHHTYFVYVTKAGVETRVRTYFSRGSDADINAALLGDMAKQCKISRAEFEQLIDCTLSQEEYEARLKEQGLI